MVLLVASDLVTSTTASSARCTWIGQDTILARVVGKPLELQLDRLAQVRRLDDRVQGLLARKLLVKVGSVDRRRDRGLEGWLDLLGHEVRERDRLEERMLFDRTRSIVAQTLIRVTSEQI